MKYKTEIMFEPNKRFQWIKTENMGTIDTIISEDAEMYYFESGRNIYKAVANEYITEYFDGDVILSPNYDNHTDIVNPSYDSRPPQMVKTITNPVYDAIKKTKKKEVFEVNIVLKIELPTKSTYEFFKEDIYESTELDAAYEELILEQSKNIDLRNALLKWFHEEYKK